MSEWYECSLDNFISDEYSICREERQYALYLHNILLKYKTPGSRKDKRVKDIFSACKLDDATVENVFYEATFMRDFFMRNRQIALVYRNIIMNTSSKEGFSEEDYRKIELLKFLKEEPLKSTEKELQNSLKDELFKSLEDGLLKSPNKDRYRNKEKQLLISPENSFNARLIKYELNRLYEKPQENSERIKNLIKELETAEDGKEMIEEINYGHNKADPSFKSELPGTTQKDFWENIQRMMNAKPDIAVVYKKKGKKYLLFIECKFESSVSTYTSRSGKMGSDIENADKTESSVSKTVTTKKTDTQETLQYRIADFLVNNGYLGEIEIADCMKETDERAGGSLVVRFTRAENIKSDDPGRGYISIKDLIDCNKVIFE